VCPHQEPGPHQLRRIAEPKSDSTNESPAHTAERGVHSGRFRGIRFLLQHRVHTRQASVVHVVLHADLPVRHQPGAQLHQRFERTAIAGPVLDANRQLKARDWLAITTTRAAAIH
jgi:hypothetical protein